MAEGADGAARSAQEGVQPFWSWHFCTDTPCPEHLKAPGEGGTKVSPGFALV